MISLWSDVKEYLGTHRLLRIAWFECARGDWLLHWAGHAVVPRKLLVLAACACARLSLQYVPASEKRPLRAIETAEAWTRGKATIEEVCQAANAAIAAAKAANAAAETAANAANAVAETAANAATDAAIAAETAAETAYYVLRAAGAASNAVHAAANARSSMSLHTAEAVRGVIAWPVMAIALESKGASLGESWVETVVASCAPDCSASDLTGEREHAVTVRSREMAACGEWHPDRLSPYWEPIPLQ